MITRIVKKGGKKSLIYILLIGSLNELLKHNYTLVAFDNRKVFNGINNAKSGSFITSFLKPNFY